MGSWISKRERKILGMSLLGFMREYSQYLFHAIWHVQGCMLMVGHHRTLSNPKVSAEAKANAQAKLKEMGEE